MTVRTAAMLLAGLGLCAGSASAQDSRGAAAASGIRFDSSAAVPAPSPTLPASPAPAPAPGLQPATDLFLAGPDTYAPRYDRQIPLSEHPYWNPGGYGYVAYPYSPHAARRRGLAGRTPSTREVAGVLMLQVEPVTAEVYVDGYYAGTVADFSTGRPLDARPHRVEIRAPGFDSVTFDVRVTPNEITRFRRSLVRTDAPQTALSAAPAAATPKTLYVIPGCYAGDKRPQAAQLPPGCDARKVRTVPPVVNTVARAR